MDLLCLLAPREACAGWGSHSVALVPPPALPGESPQPLPLCALQRCCTWWNSTWRRASLMRKLSPSSTWRHRDTSVRTSGKRSGAMVSWVPAAPCVHQLSTGYVQSRRWGVGLGVGWARWQGQGRPLCMIERSMWWQVRGQKWAESWPGCKVPEGTVRVHRLEETCGGPST